MPDRLTNESINIEKQGQLKQQQSLTSNNNEEGKQQPTCWENFIIKLQSCTDLLANYLECMRVLSPEKLQYFRQLAEKQELIEENSNKSMNKTTNKTEKNSEYESKGYYDRKRKRKSRRKSKKNDQQENEEKEEKSEKEKKSEDSEEQKKKKQQNSDNESKESNDQNFYQNYDRGDDELDERLQKTHKRKEKQHLIRDYEELPFQRDGYLKIVKKYSENFGKTYEERKKRFVYSFEEIEELRRVEDEKKGKNCWSEFKRWICCRGGNEIEYVDEIELSHTNISPLESQKNNSLDEEDLTDNNDSEVKKSKMIKEDTPSDNIFNETEGDEVRVIKLNERPTHMNKFGKRVNRNNIVILKNKEDQDETQKERENQSKKDENKFGFMNKRNRNVEEKDGNEYNFEDAKKVNGQNFSNVANDEDKKNSVRDFGNERSDKLLKKQSDGGLALKKTSINGGTISENGITPEDIHRLSKKSNKEKKVQAKEARENLKQSKDQQILFEDDDLGVTLPKRKKKAKAAEKVEGEDEKVEGAQKVKVEPSEDIRNRAITQDMNTIEEVRIDQQDQGEGKTKTEQPVKNEENAQEIRFEQKNLRRERRKTKIHNLERNSILIGNEGQNKDQSPFGKSKTPVIKLDSEYTHDQKDVDEVDFVTPTENKSMDSKSLNSIKKMRKRDEKINQTLEVPSNSFLSSVKSQTIDVGGNPSGNVKKKEKKKRKKLEIEEGDGDEQVIEIQL